MNKTVEVKILKNTYKVGFPNTGQFLDIRSFKTTLTKSLVGHDAYDQYAILLAEAIATYNVMIPELKKDLNVDFILNLSLAESNVLLDSYVKVYKPFFDGWMEQIAKLQEEETE